MARGGCDAVRPDAAVIEASTPRSSANILTRGDSRCPASSIHAPMSLLACCWFHAASCRSPAPRPTPLPSGCATPPSRRTAQTILFCYKGDIYSVPAAGGTATPKTLGESYEFAPVWSHDGKSIAFASDRYGNFDVFVMPAAGGEATRLTFHSTDEIPEQLHGRRQGRAVLRLPAGARDRRAVPGRRHDASCTPSP